MKTWYALKEDDKGAALTIFDEIGAYGVSAKAFLDDVRAVKASAINVDINSPGGDVFAGIAIYNGLRASGKTINVRVMGIAASAASLIAMAGDTIEMPENSMMMVHNPWTFAMGDANELRETADVLDKIGESLVATYAKRTGKDAEAIKTMLSAETWMSAQEAVDAGFATKVSDKVEAKASFELDRLPEAARAVFNAAKPVPTPEAKPEPKLVVDTTPLADKIVAACKTAGFDAYATLWAADATVATVDDLNARMQTAREIKSLCAVAGKPDDAEKFIRANNSLKEAREAIFAALDEVENVDTTSAASNKPNEGAQPAAVSSTSIWAARRKQTATK